MSPSTGAPARGVDDLMEKASAALAAADYFEAEALCLKAMGRARAAQDYERMSRIAMPLQESRRQRRHEACDAAEKGGVFVMKEVPGARWKPVPGCYLLEPPCIGLDGRDVRERLARKRVAALVLVREPQTKAGQWPIVGVGVGETMPAVARAYVTPMAAPDAGWFVAAQEALGDAAMAKVAAMRDVPDDHRAEDYWEYLEGVPDHEKLAQAFAEACRRAALMPKRSGVRRRPLTDNPHSF